MSNPSIDGFLEEQRIAEALLEYNGVNQVKGLKSYEIDPESVCTNLKLTIGGLGFTENDVNLCFKRSSWLLRKLSSLFLIRDVQNFAIQSKKYKNKVSFQKVMKDVVHCLITRKIGYNLQGYTMIITEDKNDSLLEAKLKSNFNVPVIREDEFRNKYEVIEKVGNNKVNRKLINMNRSITNKLGEFTVLDKGHLWWQGLQLANIDYIDCLEELNYNKIKDNLYVIQDYLNPNYYAYISPQGLTNSGEESLANINALAMNLNKLETILSKGRFFKEFSKLEFQPFGVARMVLGKAETKIYSKLNHLIYEVDHHLMTEDNLMKATTEFLTKRKYFK